MARYPRFVNFGRFPSDDAFQFHGSVQDLQDFVGAQLLGPHRQQALHCLGLQGKELLQMPLRHVLAGLALGFAVDTVLLGVPSASALKPVVFR
jgi:hypothetical protein